MNIGELDLSRGKEKRVGRRKAISAKQGAGSLKLKFLHLLCEGSTSSQARGYHDHRNFDSLQIAPG